MLQKTFLVQICINKLCNSVSVQTTRHGTQSVRKKLSRKKGKNNKILNQRISMYETVTARTAS